MKSKVCYEKSTKSTSLTVLGYNLILNWVFRSLIKWKTTPWKMRTYTIYVEHRTYYIDRCTIYYIHWFYKWNIIICYFQLKIWFHSSFSVMFSIQFLSGIMQSVDSLVCILYLIESDASCFCGTNRFGSIKIIDTALNKMHVSSTLGLDILKSRAK